MLNCWCITWPVGFQMLITQRYNFIFLYLRFSNTKLGDMKDRKHREDYIFPHYVWRTNLHICVSTVDTSKWHVDLRAAYQYRHIRIRKSVFSFVFDLRKFSGLNVEFETATLEFFVVSFSPSKGVSGQDCFHSTSTETYFKTPFNTIQGTLSSVKKKSIIK
jgi:hypothetical protein